MTKSITATILEYLKNRENMIYPNQLHNGVANKRKKYYNKRFASHEFWIRMGRELQYDL
jgi:hypothetical protein